jgi:hypothetical protein
MKRARKEKTATYIGLGAILVGAIWIGLALGTNALKGMDSMLGFPLGGGLLLTGVIIAGVYYFRWRKIERLVNDPNLLARWKDGEDEVFISPACGYIYGELHLWSGFGERLDEVSHTVRDSYGKSMHTLEIKYSNQGSGRDVVTGGRLWEKHTVSVFVPEGKAAEADRVVEALKARIAV